MVFHHIALAVGTEFPVDVSAEFSLYVAHALKSDVQIEAAVVQVDAESVYVFGDVAVTEVGAVVFVDVAVFAQVQIADVAGIVGAVGLRRMGGDLVVVEEESVGFQAERRVDRVARLFVEPVGGVGLLHLFHAVAGETEVTVNRVAQPADARRVVGGDLEAAVGHAAYIVLDRTADSDDIGNARLCDDQVVVVFVEPVD